MIMEGVDNNLKAKKKSERNARIIAFFISILLIFISGYLHISHKKFIDNAISAIAEVTNIKENYDPDGLLSSYTLDIKYTVEDKTYKAKIMSSDDEIKVGDYITIYCDKDNLEKVTQKDAPLEFYLIAMLGIFFLIAIVYCELRDYKIYKILKQNIYVFADITSITAKELGENQKAECITCEAIVNGKKRIFTKEFSGFKPLIKEVYRQGHNKIKIYLDSEKESNYLIDVDEYINLYKNDKGN